MSEPREMDCTDWEIAGMSKEMDALRAQLAAATERIGELEAELAEARDFARLLNRAQESPEDVIDENQRLTNELDEARKQACEHMQDGCCDLANEVVRLREALEKCADPHRYHAPCVHCCQQITECGSYIAKAALRGEGGEG